MKMKTRKAQLSTVIHETEKLINDGHLIVDSLKSHIIVIDSFWILLDKSGQENFIRNMANYCKLKNAYEGVLEDDYKELLLIVKSIDMKINNVFKLVNGKIEEIDLNKTS